MIYFCGILSDIWDGIIGNIYQAIRGFMYSVCVLVYKLVIYLYNLFDVLCHSRIMDSQVVQQISARVGLILGLIMLFYVSFSFIKMLIDPDTITDKEKGAFNIVKKVLIVIVLIGITPYLFDFAFDIQNKILGANDSNSNVISRLLLPEVVETDNFGGVLSANIFLSFYDLNPLLKDYSDDPEYVKCVSYRNLLQKDIIENGDFDLGYNCIGSDNVIKIDDLTSGSESNIPVIDFNFVLSFVVGLFVCWMLLMYCFSVGVRVIQLAFLQIISPMAIISYLSPKKDGMFQKWGKMCFTTYLDVFIRVGIINFIVLLIAYVINGFDNLDSTFWESVIAYKTVSSTTKVFLKIIMILALLQFAKKAPELLKDLFPNASVASGDFGFGLKNRSVLGGALGKGLAVAGGVAAGGALGLAGGILGGNNWKNRISGAVGGLVKGGVRGSYNGLKTKDIKGVGSSLSKVRKNQATANLNRAQRIASGTPFSERAGDAVRSFIGAQSAYSTVDAEVSAGQAVEDSISSNSNYKKTVQRLNQANENLSTARLNAETLFQQENAQFENDYNTKLADIENKLKTDKDFTQEDFNNLKARYKQEKDNNIAAAESRRDVTVSGAQIVYDRAKKNKDAFEAAIYALASGQTNDEYFTNFVKDKTIVVNKDDQGNIIDCSIDGLKVNNYDGTAVEIKNYAKVTGVTPSNYEILDNRHSKAQTARRDKHKGSK